MMPFSEPKKTTVWFLWGPASLSTTIRVKRYLEDGTPRNVNAMNHFDPKCLTISRAAHGDEEQQQEHEVNVLNPIAKKHFFFYLTKLLALFLFKKKKEAQTICWLMIIYVINQSSQGHRHQIYMMIRDSGREISQSH